MRKLLIILSSLSMLWASAVHAADCDQWTFNIIPFFWAVNITGDIEVGVPQEGIENQLLHISENFSTLWKHVHSGGMLDVNANKGKFGLFVTGMYASIKDIEVTTSDGFDVSVNSKFALFSAGALYRIYEKNFTQNRKWTFAPYVGARYTKNESSAVLTEAPEFGDSHEAHWTEPFVGAMFIIDFDKRLSLNVAADIGGFIQNQDSYNVIALIGYEAFERLTIYLGYRQLYQSFTQGSGTTFFEWKMHIHGPILGVAFGF